MNEITIKVSNEEKRMSKKHMAYDCPVNMTHQDETLRALVADARKDFGEGHDRTQIICRMEWVE